MKYKFCHSFGLITINTLTIAISIFMIDYGMHFNLIINFILKKIEIIFILQRQFSFQYVDNNLDIFQSHPSYNSHITQIFLKKLSRVVNQEVIYIPIRQFKYYHFLFFQIEASIQIHFLQKNLCDRDNLNQQFSSLKILIIAYQKYNKQKIKDLILVLDKDFNQENQIKGLTLIKMKVIALLVVLAVANASLATKYPLQYGGKRSIMNIMMEVENKLKSGGPLETVTGVLNGFKNAVGFEQAQHDEVQQLQAAECASEIAYRSGEVQQANNILRTASEILKTSQILIGKTSSTLQAVANILTQTRQHIGIINDIRKEQGQSYNRAAVTFNEALNAIDDSLDLVAEHSSGKTTFAQIADLSTRLLKSAIALKKTQSFMAPMAVLAQLSQAEGDSGAIERLGQLLSTLRAEVEKAWNQYGELNAVSLNQFNAQKETFTNQVARLEKVETQLTNKLEHLQGVVSVQTAVAQAASNRRSRNQTLWDDATALCGSFDIEYQTTTAGRRAELVLVAELERLVQRRLAEKIINYFLIILIFQYFLIIHFSIKFAFREIHFWVSFHEILKFVSFRQLI
ncbi:hypothetical protein pb186bvf_002945 [Paramecium bursaria]